MQDSFGVGYEQLRRRLVGDAQRLHGRVPGVSGPGMYLVSRVYYLLAMHRYHRIVRDRVGGKPCVLGGVDGVVQDAEAIARAHW